MSRTPAARDPRTVAGAFPLSAAQTRIWFAEQHADVGAAYVIDASLRLSGEVDVERLRRALHHVIMAHPLLSARVSTGPDGTPRQAVSPETAPPFDVVAARDEEEAMRLAEGLLAQPLDLTNGPTCRALLVRTGPRRALLVFAYHHLFGDGPFSTVLRREIVEAYRADSGDEQVDEPELVYASIVDASAGSARRHEAAVSRAVARLHGAPPASSAPTDRTRAPGQSNEAWWTPLALSPELISRVESVARDWRTTPFVLFSLTGHLVIGAMSGQSDTVLGFMSAQRRRGQRECAGLFAATLAQRLSRGGNPTVREAVTRLQADLIEAVADGDAPIEAVAEGLGVSRTAGRHPVFQTMINVLDLGPAFVVPGAGGELRFEPLVVPMRRSWLDLEFRLAASAGRMDAVVRAPRALYDAGTISSVASAFVELLAQLVEQADAPLSALDHLGAAAREAVIATATGPERAIPTRLDQLIELRFTQSPQDLAIVAEDTEWTFAELDLASRRVAAALRSRGVRKDDLVGVCAHRGAWLVATLVGVIRAGACFLPLDPAQPGARTAFMLADAGAVLVVVGDGCDDAVAGSDIAHARVADLVDGPVGVDDDGVDGTVPAARLAYLLYTSGSTGQPKGVECTRAGLVNRLLWMRDELDVGEHDRLLQKTPYTFDVAMWEFFLPFVSGSPLVVAPPEAHQDPSWLGDIIDRHAVTVVHFVPSMLHMFAHVGQLKRCRSLRHVVCSGEVLTTELATRVLEDCDAELWNLYGPTEASIDVTTHGCRRDGVPVGAPTIPIGRPVDNTVTAVLDAERRLVPVGAAGELYIGGVQLADRYRNRRELTEERFLPGPSWAGGRLFRTGDRVRTRADGTIEYLGRVDRQLKVRGVRIEPAEIEEALHTLPGVTQSAVGLRDGALVAYVVGEPWLTAAELTGGLAGILPLHLLPAGYHLLDGLPRLGSGKIDHAALATMETAPLSAPDAGAATAPEGPVEKVLLDAMRAVLARDELGVQDSFFAHGGDSLRSVELVARARAHGVHVAVADVFERPTMRQLAAAASAHTPRPADLPGPFELTARRPGMPDGTVAAMPLSSALVGLVVESARRQSYRVYVTGLTVSGTWDARRAAVAVAAVVASQPVLRSHLWRAQDEDEPVLVVRSRVAVPVLEHDLRGVEGADAVVAAFEDGLTRQAFDWFAPPLCRFDVHLLDDERFRLTLSEPFLDGYSAALVLGDVLAELSGDTLALLDRDENATAALVEHVRAERAAAVDDASLTWWRDQLADAAASRVDALDGPAEKQLSSVSVDFGPEVSRRLAVLNRSTGIPLKSMLLAAHTRAVATLTARRDVTVGVMANCRPETGAGATTAGLFLNVNPMRIEVQDGSWWDLVRAVHDLQARVLPHRQLAYATLRRAGLTPDVGTLFNFTHFRAYGEDRGRVGLKVIARSGSDQTYFPLTAQFQLDAVDATVKLRLEFYGAALPTPVRDAVQAVFVDAVRAVADTPHARHGGASLGLSAPTAVPSQMAAPAIDPGGDATVVDLVLAAASAAGGRCALVDGDGEVSFAELLTRVRSLAGALTEAGVQPGDAVGVELPRSCDLVVAALAVLLCGGAYTPIDASWPAARRQAALRSAAVTRIIGMGPGLISARAAGSPLRRSLAHRDAVGFVIFTSGSTGEPRPVDIPHRVIADRIGWYLRHAPIGPDERLVARAPIGFVDSVCELLTGPAAGVETHLLADTDDPTSLAEHLTRSGATRLTIVPSLLLPLLVAPTSQGLAAIRHWTLSGEPLAADLVAELERRFPDAVVENFYGATEIGADATWFRVGTPLGADAPSVPAGWPIDGVSLAVTDPWGNVVPAGVPGELQAAGGCLALGYRGDTEQTAARFREATWTSGLAFSTRDIACFDPTDGIRLLGRADGRRKVRGVFVDPVAVEARLRSAAGVEEVAVVHDPDDGLTCYLVGDESLDVTALRAHITAFLPPAAMPSRFGRVVRMPRTASGKIDRQRLGACVVWLSTTARAQRPAESVVELELMKLWIKILGRAPDGVGVNFFDVGANSLHAVMLSASAQRRFGVRLSIPDIFQLPTVQAQAELIEMRMLAEV